MKILLIANNTVPNSILLKAPGTVLISFDSENIDNILSELGFEGQMVVVNQVDIDRSSVFCPDDIKNNSGINVAVMFLKGKFDFCKTDFVFYRGWQDQWLKMLVAKHRELFSE